MKSGTNTSPTIMENENVHGNGEAMPIKTNTSKDKLRAWLNRYLRIKMTDGRVLTGVFLCTDRDANVILSTCEEYLSEEHSEARALGLVMVPGRHIISIHLDDWFSDEALSKRKRCISNSE